MSPFLIISRADVDKAYVWALHSSVTGTLRVKGNKYLSIGPFALLLKHISGMTRRQHQVCIHEAYQFLLKLIEEISKYK